MQSKSWKTYVAVADCIGQGLARCIDIVDDVERRYERWTGLYLAGRCSDEETEGC